MMPISKQSRALRALSVIVALGAAWGCVARADDIATTADGEGKPSRPTTGAKDDPKASNDDAGDSRAEEGATSGSDADMGPSESASNSEATEDPTRALSEKTSVDPRDSDRHLPLCNAPLEATFGYPTFGTEAVRLHWKPETGECKFTSGDGTPEGWSGIVTLRHHDDDLFLSGIGEWRYLAPTDLDLDALPEGETLTFYPYLGGWQFVIDIRYQGDSVTIERFQYIEGEPPEDYGVPDETSNEPIAGPMLVPCSSLAEDEAASNETSRIGTPAAEETP